MTFARRQTACEMRLCCARRIVETGGRRELLRTSTRWAERHPQGVCRIRKAAEPPTAAQQRIIEAEASRVAALNAATLRASISIPEAKRSFEIETANLKPFSRGIERGIFSCSATRFLRNSDRIIEKNSPVLRSKSETRSLASTAPKMEGAAHVKGRVLAWGGAAFAAPPLAFCPWGSSYPSVASPASSAASWAATGPVYSDQP